MAQASADGGVTLSAREVASLRRYLDKADELMRHSGELLAQCDDEQLTTDQQRQRLDEVTRLHRDHTSTCTELAGYLDSALQAAGRR